MCIIVSIRVTTTVSSMSYLFKMAYTPSQEMSICKIKLWVFALHCFEATCI